LADPDCQTLNAKLAERTRRPPALPPLPKPAIGDVTTAGSAAVDRAVKELRALDSYRFEVNIHQFDLASLQRISFDWASQGTLVNEHGVRIDALVGTRIIDLGASVSSGSRLVAGGGYVWGTDTVSGILEPRRASLTQGGAADFTPTAPADRVLLPFDGAYRFVGRVVHNGILTDHYRATAAGLAAYRSAFKFKGRLTADLWIAVHGGYASAVAIVGTGSHVDKPTGITVDDGFGIRFTVSHANDAKNTVTLPVLPVPDQSGRAKHRWTSD
jgi:hypothetical protein